MKNEFVGNPSIVSGIINVGICKPWNFMNGMLDPVIKEKKSNFHNEHELLQAAKNDCHAMAELYRRHYEDISKYIYRRVGDRSTAEDLTADVFLKMVKHLPNYRITNVPFKAWLYRIATNRVNRWARWWKLRAWVTLQEVPAKANQESELQANYVREILLHLPLPLQTVLALHYLEQMSVVEISKVLECAEGTVKSRLARARELIRTKFLKSEGAQ